MQAPLAGPTLLSRLVKLHYNWKYLFLRPTIIEIIERYNLKFRRNQDHQLGGPLVLHSSTSAPAPAPAPA